MWAKFKYVCAYEDRSANKQITHLIADAIAEYEKTYGKIQERDIEALNRGSGYAGER